MKVTIDRFEGEFAVCEQEDRTMVNILKDNIPQEAKEGDILVIEGDSISIDVKGTAERKKRINRVMDDIWK
jgi:hypothetical protein